MKLPSRFPTSPPEDEKELQAMALSPIVVEPVQPPTRQTVDDAMGQLVSSSIAKAGTLKLTPEESKALTANFDDADFYRGAAGKENLIYLQHSALRERLNGVLGMGQWIPIVCRHWTEDFTTSKQEQGVRIYAEMILIIRGCCVARAIGDCSYYKNNASQNFRDAFEGAKTTALRTCCKDFGIGLQAHQKDFCSAWCLKYTGFNRPVRKK